MRTMNRRIRFFEYLVNNKNIHIENAISFTSCLIESGKAYRLGLSNIESEIKCKNVKTPKEHTKEHVTKLGERMLSRMFLRQLSKYKFITIYNNIVNITELGIKALNYYKNGGKVFRLHNKAR